MGQKSLNNLLMTNGPTKKKTQLKFSPFEDVREGNFTVAIHDKLCIATVKLPPF